MGDETARAAADLKDALVGVDKIFVDLDQAAVIPASEPCPRIAFLRDLVPMGDAGFLVFHACFIEKWSCFHGGVIVFAVGQFAKVENFSALNGVFENRLLA